MNSNSATLDTIKRLKCKGLEMKAIICGALMALALNESSSATDLLCPPSEHGPGTLETLFNLVPPPPLDQWKHQYFGHLKEISVMRFCPAGNFASNMKSIITCHRDVGVIQMRIPRHCGQDSDASRTAFR